MSFAFSPVVVSSGDWITMSNIKVHKGRGYTNRTSDGKPVPVYRDKHTGAIKCILPKGTRIKGLSPGRVQSLTHVIVAVLLDGFPVKNPVILHKDGNKWNIQPSNLEVVTRQEAAYRKVMDNNVLPKLNAHTAMTMRDIVRKMVSEGINDYDAMGSVFRVHATWVRRVMNRSAWYYTEKYVQAVTDKSALHQTYKVREAISAYADYDKELVAYMAKGATA